MKYFTPFLALLVFLSMGNILSPEAPLESDCKVEMSTLQGQYKGECKDGLAHGRGKAIGKDEYQGEFKNGMPHGKGRYIYANGDEYIGEFRKGQRHGKGYIKKVGQEAEVADARPGIWRNDEYVKDILKGEYKWARQRNISRSSFKLIDEKADRVEISIKNAIAIDNLLINVSSGRYDMQGNARILVFQPEFPLKVLIEYETPDKLNGSVLKVIADFQLTTSGTWVVELGN